MTLEQAIRKAIQCLEGELYPEDIESQQAIDVLNKALKIGVTTDEQKQEFWG